MAQATYDFLISKMPNAHLLPLEPLPWRPLCFVWKLGTERAVRRLHRRSHADGSKARVVDYRAEGHAG